jgi:hypothetical protein
MQNKVSVLMMKNGASLLENDRLLTAPALISIRNSRQTGTF